ncbi:MAG: hypothetical protein QOD06_2582, partial [Candidatus Binatota bacterium]|nr:hypothetical protein [Candidatus Binatota bacterium]
MSSRRLWILVSLLSLPFLAYTTMGCDSVFGVPFEPKTNAYTCECSCDAGERNGTSRVLTG